MCVNYVLKTVNTHITKSGTSPKEMADDIFVIKNITKSGTSPKEIAKGKVPICDKKSKIVRAVP